MNYNTKTYSELKKILTEKNIPGRSKLTTKEDMIKALFNIDNINCVEPTDVFPKEIWLEIFKFLPVNELSKTQKVCSLFKNVIQNNKLYTKTFTFEIIRFKGRKGNEYGTSTYTLKSTINKDNKGYIVKNMSIKNLFATIKTISINVNKIKKIDLSFSKTINNDYVKILSDIGNISNLDLLGTHINNKSVMMLANIPMLKNLDISYTYITNEGANIFRNIPTLQLKFVYI